MSWGLLGPSINGSPARTRSPSCTLTWTPRGNPYSRGSAPASSGLLLLVRRVDEDQARQAGHFVDFLVHRDAFEDVLEPDLSRLLGEDGEGVGIPFDQHLALIDVLPFLHLQPRAVDDWVALAIAPL